jgi:glycosyltransferase involved in cell wall biosynthesis
VRVVKFIRYRRQNLFLRLTTWTIFVIQVFFILLIKRSPVFLTTNPPFLPLLGWLYHMLTRQSFHILYYDLYPEMLIRMGYLGKRSFVYQWWKALNRKTIRSASTLYTISDALKNELEKDNITGKVIHVIHSWSDHHSPEPLPKHNNPFIREQRLEDFFVILYSGNIGITHDMETLLTAAAALKSNPLIQFVIIGEGSRKKDVTDFIAREGLDNVRLLPWQPEEKLPYTFASADIGIVSLASGAEGLSVPSKTYSYLASGAALLAITGQDCELNNLVRGYEVGEVVRPGDSGGVYEFILKLAINPELHARYRVNALSASRNFTAENAKLFYPLIGPASGRHA